MRVVDVMVAYSPVERQVEVQVLYHPPRRKNEIYPFLY